VTFKSITSQPIINAKRKHENPITLILAVTTLAGASAAQEPGLPINLQANKEYVLILSASNPLLSDFPGRATILAPPQAGWVRIEYSRIRTVGQQERPAETSSKRQFWLNLAHVVAIEESQAQPAKQPPK
jgi:hypothetical protein